MWRTILSVALVAALGFAGRALALDDDAGFLKIETKFKDKKTQTEVVAYKPREGDLVFYDDRHPAWLILFAYAGTGPPLHMGMVVKKSDGKLAILEAGPDDTVWVKLLPLEERLHQFHRDFNGGITIRRAKKVLAADESKALTKFAEAQDGKRYAVGRLLLQGTSFRSRGPVRELVLGATVLDRDAWMCSELSVAAGTVVKLFDPKSVHANVTYPLDLVNNERHDLSGSFHDAAVWQPQRPR